MPSPKKKVETIPTEPVAEVGNERGAVVNQDAVPAVEKVVEVPVAKKAPYVIFESIDGRKMWVSINKWEGSGTRIECPRELADDAERILKAAKYLFTKIA